MYIGRSMKLDVELTHCYDRWHGLADSGSRIHERQEEKGAFLAFLIPIVSRELDL